MAESGREWQRTGGKAGACKKQQEGIWGVPTRELVAQALGCELGSLGWSRARGTAQANRGGSRAAVAGAGSTATAIDIYDASRGGAAGCASATSARGSSEGQKQRGALAQTEGGRNGTMQERQVWVWEGEVWWTADGSLLLKATSTHGQARVGTGAVGLTRHPWFLDSSATWA